MCKECYKYGRKKIRKDQRATVAQDKNKKKSPENKTVSTLIKQFI